MKSAFQQNPNSDAYQSEGRERTGYMTMWRKVSLMLFLLVTALSGVLSYIFYRSVDEMLKGELRRRGDAIAESIAESSALGVLLSDRIILIDVVTRFLGEEDVEYIWIMNRNAELLYPALSTLDVAGLDGAMLTEVVAAREKVSRLAEFGPLAEGMKSFDGYHVAVPVWRQVAIPDRGARGEKATQPDLRDRTIVELIGFVQVGLTTHRIEKQTGLVMFRATFLVVGVAFLGLFAAAIMLNRWLEPLQVVTRLAQRIRRFGFQGAVGGAEYEVEYSIAKTAKYDGADEFGLLQKTFLEMVKEIGVHDRRLREQKQRLKQMVAQRTEQLARAKEDALAANKAKSKFLASMSHELRTPLNAVIGYTEMLQHGFARNAKKQSEYLEIIRSSGQHLLSVINDILDLSKLEEGGYRLFAELFSLRQCVEEAMAFVLPKMLEKHITSSISCPDVEIINDERMMKQVLINLLSNACKFTPSGGSVNVSVKIEQEMVHILVADTGEGMTEEEVEQALQMFVQLTSGTIGPSGGTGLGLPIVDRFVKLMKGKLFIFSEKGEGTLIRIRLPIDVSSVPGQGLPAD
ncbi:sensor histidine kinase [Kordiimonas aestuarii]|uniref:sensor histidine kinase n=1 Tax=Kordiimonas aestuarii TaxID=1005925 RepID=UPI0021D14DE6|nr:ATP-binding protein [Kordiimonas aestuarii]